MTLIPSEKVGVRALPFLAEGRRAAKNFVVG